MTTKRNKIILRLTNMSISALGILPLAKEGLITPHVLTAFLCGLGDLALAGICVLNAFELGLNLKE